MAYPSSANYYNIQWWNSRMKEEDFTKTITSVVPEASDQVKADIAYLKDKRKLTRCGWSLCPFYHKDAQSLVCPKPRQGSPCQGLD